jgi:hypothetical protein
MFNEYTASTSKFCLKQNIKMKINMEFKDKVARLNRNRQWKEKKINEKN